MGVEYFYTHFFISASKEVFLAGALKGFSMKKKLLCLIFVIAITLSLSSCYLLTDISDLYYGGGLSQDKLPSDATINVTGGDNNNITINTESAAEQLAANKALLSAVSVYCNFERVSYGFMTQDVTGAGSGVIYKLDKENGDAYIITNYHVVYDASSTTKNRISDDISIYLYGMENMTNDGRTYAIPAVFVGGSMNYDIAVLKVTGSTLLMESNARACDVYDSDEVTILETAIAIGNPQAEGISATIGSISVDSEEIFISFDNKDGSSTTVKFRVLRTDAAVNSGNSGGGLFNDNGELMGIVCARDPDSKVVNVSYAIPSNVATAIADNAIYYSDGTVKRCLLGVTVGVSEYSTFYDTETGKVHKIEEVIVSEISSTSGVKGLIYVGDIINSITVDGVEHEVTRIHHVVDSMLYARVGSSVTINVTRGGTEMNITVPITESMRTVA